MKMYSTFLAVFVFSIFSSTNSRNDSMAPVCLEGIRAEVSAKCQDVGSSYRSLPDGKCSENSQWCTITRFPNISLKMPLTGEWCNNVKLYISTCDRWNLCQRLMEDKKDETCFQASNVNMQFKTAIRERPYLFDNVIIYCCSKFDQCSVSDILPNATNCHQMPYWPPSFA